MDTISNTISMSSYKILILVLLWCAYFVVHSLLASLKVKNRINRRYPALTPYYRIGFNTLALVLLIIPVGYMYANQGNIIWQWQGYSQWLVNSARLIAALIFLGTLRHYDLREFLGIKQAGEKNAVVHDQETFKISPMHRFVRHPWYFLALVIIWCGNMDILYLTSAILLTLYFFIGSKLEERKLRVYHRDIYRQYCEKVPGLIPRPWRYLSAQQAHELLENYARGGFGKTWSVTRIDPNKRVK